MSRIDKSVLLSLETGTEIEITFVYIEITFVYIVKPDKKRYLLRFCYEIKTLKEKAIVNAASLAEIFLENILKKH